jgi:hypothetical protein
MGREKKERGGGEGWGWGGGSLTLAKEANLALSRYSRKPLLETWYTLFAPYTFQCM